MPLTDCKQGHADAPTIASQLVATRVAAGAWARIGLKARLDCLQRFRSKVVESADELISACSHVPNRCAGETLASEIIPLADAARYLVGSAARILRPQTRRGWGLRMVTQHRPLGLILIIGPSNYPLFLPGVQVLQALAAGNGVILKPGAGGSAAAAVLKRLLASVGVPDDLLQVTPEATECVAEVMAEGVDKLILTGSRMAGRAVTELIAQSRPTASVMELSGADAAIVLRGADIERAAAAIAFGLTFNGGATCMVPRRILLEQTLADEFLRGLRHQLNRLPKIALNGSAWIRIAPLVDSVLQDGATVLHGQWSTEARVGPLLLGGVCRSSALQSTDQMGPVSMVETFSTCDDLLANYERSPMRLGASIFGPVTAAQTLARNLDAGCICINDLLAPTGHPAVALSPRKDSGYGSTRGAEGLLEMTSPVTVIERYGRFLPHLVRANVEDDQMLKDLLAFKHGCGSKIKASSLLRIIKRGGNSSS